MAVPFIDIKTEYAAIATEIQQAIGQVFERGLFVLGPEVEAFEREFASFIGVSHAVSVASGTDALHLALRACGIGNGDEVITVSHTAVATVAAIELSGAAPVFVDIDPRRFTMDPARVEAAITPRTRAILPVHLYGQPADLKPIVEIARARGLRLIEDACQAHGALYQGRMVGAWGDLGCFSFYPTKNLGAYGDGGIITTDDPDLAARLRLLRTYGWEVRDRSVLRGVNSRLDELQAALLRVKLRHLGEGNQYRRSLAELYRTALSGVEALRLPSEAPDVRHVYHLYVVQSDRRDEMRQALAAGGISTLIHYPTPVHLQPAYADLGYPLGSLPVSEAVASRILSLPLSPGITEAQVTEVSAAIRAFKTEPHL